MQIGDGFRKHWERESHPSFVISDPQKNSGRVLIVNASTWRNSSHDQSCILNVGDHSLISHKSYIAFNFALTYSDAFLEQKVADGKLTLAEQLRPDLLVHIIQCAVVSRFLERGYREILRNQGFCQ